MNRQSQLVYLTHKKFFIKKIVYWKIKIKAYILTVSTKQVNCYIMIHCCSDFSMY